MLQDDERLNPDHRAFRSGLRVAGPLVLGIGVIFTAVGLISFFSAFGSFGAPRYFWCAFVGMPLMAIGAGMTKIAYLGAIARYFAQETAPVAKDTFNYMAEGTAPGVRTMAHAAGEGLASGIRSGMNDEPAAPGRFCSQCGASLEASDRFCHKCGTAIQ